MEYFVAYKIFMNLFMFLVLLEYSHAHSFPYGCNCTTMATGSFFWEANVPQSLNYLLPWPFTEKFVGSLPYQKPLLMLYWYVFF